MLAGILGSLAIFAKWDYLRPGLTDQPVTLVIAKGSGSLAVGRQLQAARILPWAWPFVLAVHIDRGDALKAGEYKFPAHISLEGAIALLRSGKVVMHRLTIAEGLTVRQTVALLNAEPVLSGAIETLPPEGSLLPETYNFVLGDSRPLLIARMQHAASDALSQAWTDRDPATSLHSAGEALILASIVERETGVAEERPKVAAVFLNRLKAGMKLQSDPTVIYALSNGVGVIDHPLNHQDLAAVSPYNTYRIDGLPPAPICNPGRAALNAVLHPDNDAYLYFVATGSGGHAFAATLEDHNRNITQYLKVLKEREQ